MSDKENILYEFAKENGLNATLFAHEVGYEKFLESGKFSTKFLKGKLSVLGLLAGYYQDRRNGESRLQAAMSNGAGLLAGIGTGIALEDLSGGSINANPLLLVAATTLASNATNSNVDKMFSTYRTLKKKYPKLFNSGKATGGAAPIENFITPSQSQKIGGFGNKISSWFGSFFKDKNNSSSAKNSNKYLGIGLAVATGLSVIGQFSKNKTMQKIGKYAGAALQIFSAFAGKFHSGGTVPGRGEVMAILQGGETVRTEGQERALQEALARRHSGRENQQQDPRNNKNNLLPRLSKEDDQYVIGLIIDAYKRNRYGLRSAFRS